MRLLVTTLQAFWLVDTVQRKAFKIHDEYSFYFGISFNNKQIFVCAQDSIYGKEQNSPQRQGRILVFDYNLNLLDELVPDFSMRDPHQVYCHADSLLVTGTSDEVIAIYKNGAWKAWYPFGDPEELSVKRTYHFNSITVLGDSLYLVGHSSGNGEVHEFKLSDRSHIRSLTVGRGSHNLWQSGRGDLYTMSSADGELCTLDGTDRYPISIGHFVRGACILPKTYFFGVSSTTVRDMRNQSSSLIINVDLAGRNRTLYGFEGHGEILDLRAPGYKDSAHQSYLGKKIQGLKLDTKFEALELKTAPILSTKLMLSRRAAWWWRLNILRHRMPVLGSG